MLDVAVIGGGPVGAAFATWAAPRGLSIEVFEARPGLATDARTLALSHASREHLHDALSWPDAEATPIRAIHVSQKGAPGRTRLDAAELGLPALGYTLAFASLQSALQASLARVGVPLHRGRACDAIDLAPDRASIRFADGTQVRARLLVLADGGANAARIPGIGFHEKDYAQQALVAAVHADRPHGGVAYERFTPQGPVALLPVDDRYALVWTESSEAARRLQEVSEAEFLARLQDHFGDRAGRFVSAAARGAFPLKLRRINSATALRTVIIGNAAQALHPIAGQGLNLGLRDALALADVLRDTPSDALGGPAMLEAYRAARGRDAARGIAFTDLLVNVFGDERRIPAWGRALALTALDLCAPARRVFARRMIHGFAP